MRFSRELAARLDTQGSGLAIHAGAGSLSQTEVPAFGENAGNGHRPVEPGDGAVDPWLAGASWAESGPEEDFPILPEIVDTGAWDSIIDGAAWSPEELGDAAVDPGPEAVDAADRPESRKRLRELGRAEARRARDAGEPHSGATLAKKFGLSVSWGQQRLAEIRTEGAASRRAIRVREQDRLREEACVEARRARDAGERYTGAALGKAFGMSAAWGQRRLEEIRDERGKPRQALREQEQARANVREAARMEARRARDAGEPYSGKALGQKFGMGLAWGETRLNEIRGEGGGVRNAVGGSAGGASGSGGGGSAEGVPSVDVPADEWSQLVGELLAGEEFGGMSAESAFDPAAGPAFDPLAVAGWSGGDVGSGGGVSGDGLNEAGRWVFGADAADRVPGGMGTEMDSIAEDAAGLPADLNDAEADSAPESVDSLDRPDSPWLLKDEAAVEARRAHDASQPYTAEELGQKFGKSTEWGGQRLAEPGLRLVRTGVLCWRRRANGCGCRRESRRVVLVTWASLTSRSHWRRSSE